MAAEKYDYTAVNTKINELNELFIEFDRALDDIDDNLRSKINSGSDDALNSPLGKGLLANWDNATVEFGSFKNDFTDFVNDLITVSDNNVKLEDETILIYGGVEERENMEAKASSMPRNYKAQGDFAPVMMER